MGEPFIWRSEDHAVPKGWYHAVRILEFSLMWALILSRQGAVATFDPGDDVHYIWFWCKVIAIVSLIGLYLMLPFVWALARQHELPKRGADNAAVEDQDDE